MKIKKLIVVDENDVTHEFEGGGSLHVRTTNDGELPPKTKVWKTATAHMVLKGH